METEELVEAELSELLEDQKVLVLHNDDYNTFDHVIDCLVSICKHSTIQAEQCAYIVHHNGKCSVKKGTLSKLKPMYHALKSMNLAVGLA